MTDDQRAGMQVMPNLQRYFKQEGRAFPHAFVTTPLCCPSRSSILTGLYAHNHHVTSNRPGSALDDMVLQNETIEQALRDAGYRTGLFGKFLNTWSLTKPPPDFDVWAMGHGGYTDAQWNFGHLTADGSIEQNVVTDPRYNTDVIRSEVTDFIETSSDKPWFAYVAVKGPHSPYEPEPRYRYAAVPGWHGNPAVREEDPGGVTGRCAALGPPTPDRAGPAGCRRTATVKAGGGRRG